jgi:hypothetical protein
MTVSGVTANSLVVTWNAGDPAAFSVNLTAFNDDLLDSPENIVLTLSGQTVDEGNATLVAGDDSAVLNITDNDQSLNFSVSVDDEGAESAGTAVGISEENTADNAATFTVSLSGALSTGNSASVELDYPGTATDAVDYTACH